VPGTSLLRGRIYGAVFEQMKDEGEKFYLVVSNNRRNAAFPQVLAIRMTTTPPRSPRPAVVEVDRTDVFTGYAVCDNIVELYPDEITRERGALSRNEIARVEAGLRAALGL
jgi:mRNA interferase MazF